MKIFEKKIVRLIKQPYGSAVINHKGRVAFLNSTASRIYKHYLNKKITIEIATILGEEYNVSKEMLIDDVSSFIEHLCMNYSLDTNPDSFEITGTEDYTSIVEANISLTNKCNLNCKYCVAESGKILKDELNTEQWLLTAKTLLNLGMRKATISGGEPLLSKSFLPLVKYLSDENIVLQIFSNGILIDNHIVEELKGLDINLVQISLDSTKESEHNRYRGNSHNKALNAIDLLVKADIPTVISAIIFPDTINEISNLAKYADSMGVLLRCNPIEPRGRGAGFDNQATVVNPELHELINNKIEEVSKIYTNVFTGQEVKFQMHMFDKNCPFSKGSIAVTSNGKIRACCQSESFFKEIAAWSIDNKPVYEYNETIEEHSAFYTISNILPEICPSKTICSDCNKFNICRGCLLAGHSCNLINKGGF